MSVGTDWKSRPSLLHYSGTYILAIIALVSIYKLEHIIYPGTYHPGITSFFFDYLLITPIEQWPFQNPKFVGIFVLQACTLVVLMKVAYRLLQTALGAYTLSGNRLTVRHFYYYGIVTHDIDCSRINDLALVRPLPSALLGISAIQVYTNDPDAPVIQLDGLLGGKKLFKLLNAHCHRCREEANQAFVPLHMLPIAS